MSFTLCVPTSRPTTRLIGPPLLLLALPANDGNSEVLAAQPQRADRTERSFLLAEQRPAIYDTAPRRTHRGRASHQVHMALQFAVDSWAARRRVSPRGSNGSAGSASRGRWPASSRRPRLGAGGAAAAGESAGTRGAERAGQLPAGAGLSRGVCFPLWRPRTHRGVAGPAAPGGWRVADGFQPGRAQRGHGHLQHRPQRPRHHHQPRREHRTWPRPPAARRWDGWPRASRRCWWCAAPIRCPRRISPTAGAPSRSAMPGPAGLRAVESGGISLTPGGCGRPTADSIDPSTSRACARWPSSPAPARASKRSDTGRYLWRRHA